jgi:hypothetical protein
LAAPDIAVGCGCGEEPAAANGTRRIVRRRFFGVASALGVAVLGPRLAGTAEWTPRALAQEQAGCKKTKGKNGETICEPKECDKLFDKDGTAFEGSCSLMTRVNEAGDPTGYHCLCTYPSAGSGDCRHVWNAEAKTHTCRGDCPPLYRATGEGEERRLRRVDGACRLIAYESTDGRGNKLIGYDCTCVYG